MEATWFYAKNDQRHGPVSTQRLRAMAQSGELLPGDLVWKEGLENWLPASRFNGLFDGAAPPPLPPTERRGFRPASAQDLPAGVFFQHKKLRVDSQSVRLGKHAVAIDDIGEVKLCEFPTNFNIACMICSGLGSSVATFGAGLLVSVAGVGLWVARNAYGWKNVNIMNKSGKLVLVTTRFDEGLAADFVNAVEAAINARGGSESGVARSYRRP